MRIKPILTILLLTPVAHAEIGATPGSQQVTPVFALADVVCNCLVQSIAVADEPIQVGEKPALRHHVTASVEVIDSYKENSEAATIIFIEYTQDEQQGRRISGARQSLRKGETVLLFLKGTSPGVYSFADPFLGVTAFRSLPPQQLGSGILKLQHALVAVAHATDKVDQIKALRLLQGFDNFDQDSLSSLAILRTSEDPEIALTTLGVLLKTKSPESVQSLEHYLVGYKSDAEPMALISIGTELGQIRDARALPAIRALSGSKYISIRLGAMDAMRSMRNPASVSTLVKRLDDSNDTVQYIALITLAETLRKYDGDFAPTMNLFDKNPQYYLGLWKRWWADEGLKLFPPEKDSP